MISNRKGNFNLIGLMSVSFATVTVMILFSQSFVSVDTSLMTGNTNFVQLGQGYNHSCALTEDGQVYCWGSDRSGEIGDGSGSQTSCPDPFGAATPIGCALAPRKVNSSELFTELTVGVFQACALTSDGRVFCWGWTHGFGEVNMVSTLSPRILDTTQVVGALPFKHIGSGYGAGFGVATDGTPYGWGGDSFDEVGDGSGSAHMCQYPLQGALKPCAYRPVPMELTAITGSTEVSMLSSFCFLTNDGKIYCWGENNGRPRPTPVSFSQMVGTKVFSSIYSRERRTCGINTEGNTYCWSSRGPKSPVNVSALP